MHSTPTGVGAQAPAVASLLTPLYSHPQWLPVLLVPKAGGRTDKLPLNPTTAAPCDAHDAANWTTHAQALAQAQAWGSGFTVGFVLTAADPFWCLDIDGALQPDGTWSPLALQLCQALPGTCVEVSQSGEGLHIWGQGPVPPHSKKNIALHIELYTESRFIAIGSGAVGDMSQPCPQIAAIAAYYFPEKSKANAAPDEGPSPEWNGPTDDDDLLRRAMQSKSSAGRFGGRATFADLWTADTAALARAYPADSGSAEPYDRSSADAALAQHLAFWTGRDAARIERLMRRSALARPKWDDREDYLVERTIGGACSMQREVLRDKPPPERPAPVADGRRRYPILPDDPLNTARALIERHYTTANGASLKAWQGAFYQWDGARWLEMQLPDVRARLYDFLDREGESFYRPTQTKVSNLLDSLRAAAHLDSAAAPPCWIDRRPLPDAAELVACANGLLHLPTRTMHPPSAAFFNLNAVPFDYQPKATAPQWLQFLAQVWPNDPEAIATLQEIFGHLLTPDTSQQKIFLIVGPKRSGKGTIARVLSEMLGADNVAGPTLSSMAGPFGLQPLVGNLAAIISDARLSGRTDQKEVAENLLRISGEDRIQIDRKGVTSLTMRLGVRFLMLTNELPRIADASGAMASRFVIITMSESFLGREDPGLTSRLLGELPGVLAWAVEGWHRLFARGHFVEPKSSAGAAQELADLGSPIAAFVREECRCGPGAEVEVGELFSAWVGWCSRMGMNHSGTLHVFGRDLRAAFPSIKVTRPRVAGERVRHYEGIALSGPRWSAVNPIAA